MVDAVVRGLVAALAASWLESAAAMPGSWLESVAAIAAS